MMKLYDLCSVLPLLLGAVALPAHAQVLVVGFTAGSAVADAAASTPPLSLAVASPESAVPDATADSRTAAGAVSGAAWENVLERRHRALLLSKSEQWVAAASGWREVLFELKKAERLGPRISTRAQTLKQEAEGELKHAQSHLSSFWVVRDLVTVGADSRNSTPAFTVRPAAQSLPLSAATSPTVASSALVGLPLIESAAPEVALTTLMVIDLAWPGLEPRAAIPRAAIPRAASARAASARAAVQPRSKSLQKLSGQKLSGQKLSGQKPSNSSASLRWAHAQWWARPMVQVGADSRNSMLAASLPDEAPLSTQRLVIAPGGVFRASALVKVPATFVRPPVAQVAQALAKQAQLPAAPMPGAPMPAKAPERKASAKVGHSWTMQIRLPSAHEAALAAGRPLGS